METNDITSHWGAIKEATAPKPAPRKLKVYTLEIRNNCAGEIFYNLGSTLRSGTRWGGVHPTPTEVNEDLEVLEQRARFSNGRGVAEIWINDEQHANLHDLLVGRGYKMLFEGRNPNHGLKPVYLYIKDLTTLKRAEVSGVSFG